MSLDPAALPLLLAGPVLRRVESDLVCVWIATSQRCDVSLLLFEGTDVAASSSLNDDLRAPWVSALQQTLQYGRHFHVLTVTLDLRSPGGNASRSAGPLKSNHGYSYDLRLHPQSDPTNPLNLRALGLLAGPVPLGYDLGELPSFKTAPEDRDKLVIVHGSCRRMFETPPLADDPALDGPFPPPGGWPTEQPTPSVPIPDPAPVEFPEQDYPTVPKRDGCLWIDALIDPRGPMPDIATRPHQLFLTGDQIYADDVPAVLLPVLNHVGRVLVGDEELPVDAVGSAFVPATSQLFPPAFRRDISTRRAGFTTTDGGSHLFTFGEFVAYYVLTWSPELWTRDLWPADFDPAKIVMPLEWRDAFLYEDAIAQPPVKSGAYEELLEALPETGSGVPGAPPGRSEHPDVHAQWYFDQRRLWLTSKFWSPALFEWWMRRFREGLPRVRRALANVPTYMIADDHEITDDWNFSRQWREAVFTRPLGVDIIRHGLMAYSLMQGWGNDPRRWAGGVERELLEQMRTWIGAAPAARRTSLNRLHELLGLPFTAPPNTVPTFRPLVQYSYRVEGPCHRVLVVDGRTRRRFPSRNSQAGGIDYEGPTGLFGDSAMAEALPEPPANDTKITFVVTGVPVLGPDGMELALLPFQRLARLLLNVDAEAWSYEPATFEALLWALSRYRSVVLLSGDIHVAFSAALDYWSAPAGQEVRTARIVQLISSGITQDWGGKTPVLKANALTHDVFEAETTETVPTERVGWGTPVRTALTPPVALGKMVTVPIGKVPHPSYRARLKMRAPVVPTHGWPAGTTEERPPDWGWRLAMERDQRPESTSTPSIERRWTPVERPIDPVAPGSLGWHAKAVRRLAYGRVFAFERNIGIVTLERSGEAWSVRHVIAGELPPLAETGTTPAGLQPYVIHRIALTPQPPATWITKRPRVRDDGGWGVDPTEPALQLLLHWLPLIWRGAAKHVDPFWPDLPANLDEPARDALITSAADRISGTFRRRVLRELGPFSAMTDAQLDAITEPQIAALANHIGKFEIAKEARALVRPDLERMMNLDTAATDRAAFFDDVLLIACSDWVNERNGFVSLIAGLLATFRSPITRHFPVLAGLLGGLWDRWRFGTNPEFWTPPALPAAVGGLVSLPPRIGAFVREMLNEFLVDLIEDHNPRREGGPPIVTPELALAVVGAVFSLKFPKRMTTASGWEDLAIPVAPGARRGDPSPPTLARQTLSLLVHPGNRARFVAPAQRFSLTLIPPADALSPGQLFAGWDAKFQIESGIGGGIIQRVATEGGGWLKQPWAWTLPSVGVPGARLVMSFLRPTTWTPAEGIELRFTPSIAIALGFTNDAAGLEPTFEFRLSLNDTEDRIALKPKNDGFLAQILPTDGITLPLDATVAWDVQRGWRFLGLGDLARFVAVEKKPAPATPPTVAQKKVIAQKPFNKKLGLLTLTDRSFDLGYDGDGDGVTISATLSGTVSLNVGPMRFSVSGLGAKVNLHIPSDPLEDFDLRKDVDVDPATPTGLAVSVSGKVVEGGGFLQRIETPTGAVSWRGGLTLRLTKRVDVGSWAIIEAGDGRHWSLLVFLVARFSPPLKLSTGWRLVSIGGMLGLHRTMNTDALRDAALGVGGNLDALFLPDRPEQRFLELMPVADRFFPAAEDHHVGGIMAVFEWGVTAKKTNARFRAALLLEIGNDQLALYGTAQFGFPTLDADQVVRIRAGFEALYDVERKFVRVSLTLTEATLFRRVHLTGGAALLIRWGDDDEFAFTLGGFHPAFRPYIPEGMREPPRLGAHWKPKSLLDLDLQAYFAFTSTSLQFGASAYLEAGASWGGVRGDIAFNMIVMSEPKWYFETDLSFRVTAFLFGCDLISAGLRGAISGPGPWHLEATVYWEVCGVDISKDLGPYEWGETDSVSTQVQEARQILGDGLEDAGAWSVRRAGRLRVQLREGHEGAIDPRDQIEVRQSRLPLGTGIEVHDRNPLSDGGTWTLSSTTAGLAKSGDLTDVFPMRRYRAKPPKETPFQRGLVSGARFGGSGWDVHEELAVGSDEDAAEDLVLDSLPQPPRRIRVPVRVLLSDAARLSAPTLSIDRNWTRHAILLEARK
jgi:hypothetical protein